MPIKLLLTNLLSSINNQDQDEFMVDQQALPIRAATTS